MEALQRTIEEAWQNRALLQDDAVKAAVEQTIALLDQGQLRVAQKVNETWITHEWIKKAILLYFAIRPMEVTEAGILKFYDKIPLKENHVDARVRVVPHGLARYGAYLAPGVILMPAYVNIGAYVDSGTLIDTWATVGSCAQIGCNVHISGGVGIGGVLEPVQASPVIIEDHCFIGSRCIIVEGVVVEREAVLGANVVLTASTRIIDVTGSEPVEYRGRVPARSVVIPGTTTKTFNAGSFQVPCALIIGKRKASTDQKTSLNEALREFGISS
ncbi:MAG: 2,3,4,5-tetrahydropyridine-2,6-dicarboxylate N-succinyltransferase [Chitinophagales bacterium]|nr:2,3,4,5-tetrahydropyridine-2,6-dicarboxylate N-succinyltransferase [Chitinophagales bacterium]MDW8428148.1 2,3,4,5-tetrahydropyridine-2,6-dicarboxylate N-succinyltransferase [Chitinophagales bacterium]